MDVTVNKISAIVVRYSFTESEAASNAVCKQYLLSLTLFINGSHRLTQALEPVHMFSQITFWLGKKRCTDVVILFL